MPAKKGAPSRIERGAGDGKFKPTGTEKKDPTHTVTEPRRKPKKT